MLRPNTTEAVIVAQMTVHPHPHNMTDHSDHPGQGSKGHHACMGLATLSNFNFINSYCVNIGKGH